MTIDLNALQRPPPLPPPLLHFPNSHYLHSITANSKSAAVVFLITTKPTTMPEPAQEIIIEGFPDLVLCFVEGGQKFMMGDDNAPLDREKPAHPVVVSSFYMGKYPVTQALWKKVTKGQNPSRFKGDRRPVETVSWEEAVDFIKKLNEDPDLIEEMKKKNLPAAFRLPREAEWEYAARGGRHSQGYQYAGSDNLEQVGWYDKNSGNETKEVGLLLPNELGFHDMSGNVWEWCSDWYVSYDQGKKDLAIDPQGPDKGDYRVFRGGSYFNYPRICRCSSRTLHSPVHRGYLGFRLCLPFQFSP